jgi:hypothetical protein
MAFAAISSAFSKKPEVVDALKRSCQRAHILTENEILSQMDSAFAFLRAHFTKNTFTPERTQKILYRIKDLFEESQELESSLEKAILALSDLYSLDLESKISATLIYETLSPFLKELRLKDSQKVLEDLSQDSTFSFKKILLLCALKCQDSKDAKVQKILEKNISSLQKMHSLQNHLKHLNKQFQEDFKPLSFKAGQEALRSLQGYFLRTLGSFEVKNLPSLLKSLPSISPRSLFFSRLVLQNLESRYFQCKDFKKVEEVVRHTNEKFPSLPSFDFLNASLLVSCLASLGKLEEARGVAGQSLEHRSLTDKSKFFTSNGNTQKTVDLNLFVDLIESFSQQNLEHAENLLKAAFKEKIPFFYQKLLDYFQNPTTPFPVNGQIKRLDFWQLNPELIPCLVLLSRGNIEEMERQLPNLSEDTLQDLYWVCLLTSRFELAQTILLQEKMISSDICAKSLVEMARMIQRGNFKAAVSLTKTILKHLVSLNLDPKIIFNTLFPQFILLLQKNSQEAAACARAMMESCSSLIPDIFIWRSKFDAYYYIDFQIAKKEKDLPLISSLTARSSDALKVQLAIKSFLESNKTQLPESIIESIINSTTKYQMYQIFNNPDLAFNALKTDYDRSHIYQKLLEENTEDSLQQAEEIKNRSLSIKGAVDFF